MLVIRSAYNNMFCTLDHNTGRDLMKSTAQSMSWVVYQIIDPKIPQGMKAVCEQREWDAMQLAQPGHHRLVQAGITNEGEAERLARRVPVAQKV
jgi:hypothetical protein